jgi:hypothetical protein
MAKQGCPAVLVDVSPRYIGVVMLQLGFLDRILFRVLVVFVIIRVRIIGHLRALAGSAIYILDIF